MLLLQQELFEWLLAYVLDILVSFILGLLTSLLYFLIRPRASFWFAKQRTRIFRRGMLASIDSLITFNIDEVFTETPLDELNEKLNLNPNIDSEILQSSTGSLLQINVKLTERSIKFQGRLSIDTESGIPYALKTKTEDAITFSNIDNHVESLFTVRDMLYDSMHTGSVAMGQLPAMAIGLSWNTGKIKMFQWLDQDHELNGFISIPSMDIKIFYESGRAVISSIRFQPYIKEVIQNLVVESTMK